MSVYNFILYNKSYNAKLLISFSFILYLSKAISAKPSPPLSPAPPPTIYRNTLHGYILCEAGVISDIVKGTKHVKLWEPYQKEMEALAKTAKECTTKKDVKQVKK